MQEKDLTHALAPCLLPWYKEHARDLPWRRDRQPYRVWISEIMLQQTRVEAVIPHYIQFIAQLPDPYALADVSPELLHKLWEGLGYYRRADYLKKAAVQIVSLYGGQFPKQYAQIRALAGIGAYTAGAICSICFEQPTPAVDGNVLRVLARLQADATPCNTPAARQNAEALLAAAYPPQGQRGDFTQALMELGATVCLPNGAPHCASCPLAALCCANASGTQLLYPVRTPKKARPVQEMTVFIFLCGDRIALRRRPATGLLAGLWELPHTDGLLQEQHLADIMKTWGIVQAAPIRRIERTHVFTHVAWNMRGYYFHCSDMSDAFEWFSRSQLAHQVAVPTAFRQFLTSSLLSSDI